MAYNSDGYIMLDFTEVDFRRTNQTIEGLYKRCVDVIGTNKFILVINANGRTPLPATCSFTNNQYVIDTCIYMFAISSNDNLFIRRNDVPASDIIDDSSISVNKTWSSNKIDSELDTKADASALADYQPKLTAGTNITIDENNIISSTGGAVIDDSVIVNNKVWSSLNTVEKLAPIDTIVTNPAVFNTSLELPLVECKSSFMATQEGTGDPSPTNVRPIHGYSSIDIMANGTHLTVNFGREVYGGVYDNVSGKLILTDQIIDLNSLNWEYMYNTFITLVDDLKTSSECISTCYKYSGISVGSTRPDFSIGTSNYFGDHRLSIKDTNYDITTITQFIDSLINQYCVYKLDTPIEIQLTPITQINTIMGANSIESDTGNIKVSYKYLPEDLF